MAQPILRDDQPVTVRPALSNGRGDACLVSCGSPTCRGRRFAHSRVLYVTSLSAVLAGRHSDDDRYVLAAACPRCGAVNRL